MGSDLSRFCTVENHLMRGKNLFRAYVLHDGRFHIQLKFVADIRFGEIKLFIQRIQRDFLVEIIIDIIDERGDDLRGFLLNGRRGMVQLDQKLNGFA